MTYLLQLQLVYEDLNSRNARTNTITIYTIRHEPMIDIKRFEGVIRRRNSQKDRLTMANSKRADNDLQNTKYKTTDRATRTH